MEDFNAKLEKGLVEEITYRIGKLNQRGDYSLFVLVRRCVKVREVEELSVLFCVHR